ncbi:uncharacterized protein LOC117173314 [Belonocnema kinseyi]|uniref:uncharacterized protein LOC117173314 n=1 Tax=Belonocnema kinseyi TaxID=2817044 RepID=UPI00143D6834|nr:uncharacterized protein LOC117173314 [Belonocnema kinseyi]
MTRTAVAMLLINSVVFFYFIGLSSQSSVDPGSSSSGNKTSQASSFGSQHLRGSSTESKRSGYSNSASKRSLASSSGTQLPPEINRKGLHIPDGVEVWWEKDKIIAMEQNGVYRPFLFFAQYAMIQAVVNKKDPSKIGFNVVILSSQEWLSYMAKYAAYKKRDSILYSARSTVLEYTQAKRQALEELRLEREREAAFKELYKYDKKQGLYGDPEQGKSQ